MTYTKKTFISGKDRNQEFIVFYVNGHWDIQKAIKKGRKHGIIGSLKIEHRVFDGSGHGRGGHDGVYRVDECNNWVRAAAWSEFGVEH